MLSRSIRHTAPVAFRGRMDGSPPPPQTVGAANDCVLTMLAISAHEKVVGGLLARGMWEGTEQTFGAANRLVARVVQRTWEELLSLRFLQRNWGRAKGWLPVDTKGLPATPSSSSLAKFSQAL